MSKDFSVRLYKEGDEKEIIELLRQAFPYWATRTTPLDYWKWKYSDSPNKSEIGVALSNGKIIGAAHRFNFRTKIGDTFIDSTYGDDAVTHPEYRGIGVHSQLEKLLEEAHKEKKARFYFEVTENPMLIKNYAKRGRTKFPFKIFSMIKVRDIGLHLKEISTRNPMITSVGFNILKKLNNARNSLTPDLKPKVDLTISDIKHFNNNHDSFWDKVKENYNFILEKNSDYLNWRYCDGRGGNYIAKQAMYEGETLGFIVLELKNTEGYTQGYIVDLLATPERGDVADALLTDACSYFEDRDVNIIHYELVKGHLYEKLFAKHGFVDTSLVTNLHFYCDFKYAEREYEIIKSSPPTHAYFSRGDYY